MPTVGEVEAGDPQFEASMDHMVRSFLKQTKPKQGPPWGAVIVPGSLYKGYKVENGDVYGLMGQLPVCGEDTVAHLCHG